MPECLGGHKCSAYERHIPVLDRFLVSSGINCPVCSGELVGTRGFMARKRIGSLGELDLVSAISVGTPFSKNIFDDNDPLGNQVNGTLELFKNI